MKHISVKLLFLVTIVSIVLLGVQSCSLFSPVSNDDDGDDDKDPTTPVTTTLYKLTEDTASHTSGVPATIYMIGAVHVGKNPYTFSSTIQEKFSESDVFVMESLPQTDAEANRILAKVANDNQIDKNVPNEETKTYNTLKGYVDAYSGDTNFYDNFVGRIVDRVDAVVATPSSGFPKTTTTEPAYATFFIDAGVLEADGYDSTYGVDTYFYNKARGKKALKGLETAEKTISAFFEIDMDEQTLSLIESTNILLGAKERDTDTVITYYTTNNVEGFIQKSTLDENSDSTYKAIITDRNVAWVQSLKDLIENREDNQDVFFVVVGWGHTIILEEDNENTYSFQRLLDEDGFSLEEVAQK